MDFSTDHCFDLATIVKICFVKIAVKTLLLVMSVLVIQPPAPGVDCSWCDTSQVLVLLWNQFLLAKSRFFGCRMVELTRGWEPASELALESHCGKKGEERDRHRERERDKE